MIKKIKELIKAVAISAIFLAPIAVPVTASAAVGDQIEDGLKCGANVQFDTNGGCTTEGDDPGERLNSIVETVINVVSIIVAVVAVLMIIFGGMKYITSGGDSSNVSSAKNTIIYAIVGLVVVALAQFIVNFVLQKALDSGSGS